MTRFGLLLRNLRYFRAANLAVAAATAVATAVLTGALLVGDSVRGSLRELALQRLGRVDFALVAPWFFGQLLAERVGATSREINVQPAILVRGGASDESGRHHTGGVQVAAVGGDWLPVAPGDCMINQVLADALDVTTPGDNVLLRVPTPGDVPRDATLASRAPDRVTSQPRTRVARVEAEPGFASLFNLEGGQRLPRNAWMNLPDLQREIRQPRRANVLLVDAGDTARAQVLNKTLRDAMHLDDYALKIVPSEATAEHVLGSRSTYLLPAVDEAADRVARRLQVPLRRVSVQLVNNVVKLDASGGDGEMIHYAVAAGISLLDGADPTLADDEIALNEWAAARLKAKPGDRIRLDYYQRRADGELEEVRSDRPGIALTFRVKRILPMTGLGADRTLTPEYPGLTDKARIREAPPELGISDELLDDDDETYWQQYRAAPKLFLSLQTAKRLWGEAYGELTSIRVPSDRAAEFERELLKELDPAAAGMSFRALKAEQLAAATGSTDFSMLFVGLSFFLIASAALLVAMIFRLGVEQRARQFGVMQAMGFAPAAVFRLALAEGLILACAGGAVGVGCAVGYTWLMVIGLRTWWVDAVGTTALRTHVEPVTLAIGFAASLLIAMLAILWAARSLRRVEPVRLLSGGWTDVEDRKAHRSRIASILAAVTCAIAAVLLTGGAFGWISGQAAFFGGGSALLVACLSGTSSALRTRVRRTRKPTIAGWSIASLAVRTAGRQSSRSSLTISLIALASFLLVTVGAMRQGPPDDPGKKDSGTGGFRLILQADIPLLSDLDSRAGRERLGMREPAAPVWSSARFVSLRRWAGQDASCLNLTRPDSPTILGAPQEMVTQKRFEIARTIEKVENGWTLLDRTFDDPNDIPVIADDESARYILKLGLRDALPITDQRGHARRLRLVATLKSSIFQSELLMSEANFRRLFPFQSGFGAVLVETDHEHVDELRRRLADELDAFAVTVDSTADRLAAYRQVANTYLSTFQALGSLGLLLGTIGTAVVLLRGLIERRSELSLLSAIGFAPGRRLRLVLGENVLLLVIGLLAGTGCALVGVVPTVLTAGRPVDVTGLAVALAAVLLTGLVVLTGAAWLGGRHITPADLRRE